MNIEKSIVQIFSDKTIVNYVRPWSFSHKERSTGSGFAIEVSGFKKQTKYILTNAHCVNDSSFTTVRKQGISKTFKAKIEAIGYEVDLALLSVQDKTFWKDTLPLPLGKMPSKLAKVRAYGFPLGGYNISITQGVVNRIRVIPYFHVTKGITIQIDAPINFGNSGGPVINNDGDVIGVAFAGEDDTRTQNMGYIIPTIIIEFFLDMVIKHKSFQGICSLGIRTQPATNGALREYHQLEPHQTGIVVSHINKLSSLQGKIKVGDVIMKIDNVNIDSDGTVFVRDVILSAREARKTTKQPAEKEQLTLASDERVQYHNLISIRLPGDSMTLTVLRDGKIREIQFKTKLREFLVPILPYQIGPSYYVIGGIVFVPLTLMMLEELIEAEEPIAHLFNIADTAEKMYKDEQKIVLVEILLTELTDGYVDNFQVLKSVNGKLIRNLEHMRNVVQKELKSSKFLKFEFEDSPSTIILSSDDTKKYSRAIAVDQLGISNIYFNIPDWDGGLRMAETVQRVSQTKVVPK